MRPSMSIWMPFTEPSSGSHSAYGKLDPIMNRQSQFMTISWLGFVPSRPIEPVTYGRSSGSAPRPFSPFAPRDPHRAVHQVAHLRGRRARLHVLGGHILEQRVQVDLLLVVRAERHRLLLADDRHYRLVVELRVVEAVQQVNRTGPRGGHAD